MVYRPKRTMTVQNNVWIWIFVGLQRRNSNDTHVTLKNVTSETSGVYTCEITDKEYLTHHQEKFMNVIRK